MHSLIEKLKKKWPWREKQTQKIWVTYSCGNCGQVLKNPPPDHCPRCGEEFEWR